MEKIQKWTNIAGVISAVVALTALAISVVGIRSDIQKARINEWQEVTVFSTIVDAKLEGLTFKEIQENYASQAKDLPNELPRVEIQTQALKRILLNLIAKRAISIRSDGRYAFQVDPIMPGAIPFGDIQVRMEKVGSALLDTVSKEPDKYTAAELSNQLKSRFTFSDGEFNQLLVSMVAQNFLKIGNGGKISSNMAGP